jgi:hypothetical protein
MSVGYDEEVEDTQRHLAVAQQLPPDLMLLKMENESIMSVAQARPRNYVAIVQQLQQLVDAYPEAADEAIYSKPVGTETKVVCGGCGAEYAVPYIGKDGVQCPKCESPKVKSSRKVKKFAEGLSIRSAESIRSIYGFNRLAVRMEMLEDDRVKLSGVFVDYSTGTITADERIVSPFYTDRFKKQAKTPEDRFLGVVVKAEKSKLRRDVTLDSVPNIVKAAYRDACEKKMKAMVSKDVIEKQIVPFMAGFGLTLEHLEKIIGRPASLGWTEQDRLALKKIATALKNEETTVAELLADLDDDKPPVAGQSTDPSKATPKGPVTGSDLLGKSKSSEPQIDRQAILARWRVELAKSDSREQVKETAKRLAAEATFSSGMELLDECVTEALATFAKQVEEPKKEEPGSIINELSMETLHAEFNDCKRISDAQDVAARLKGRYPQAKETIDGILLSVEQRIREARAPKPEQKSCGDTNRQTD